MKPTFWGDEACSGPLAIFGFPGPFVASRFDPDACDLTSEQQDVYDPAASSFALTEGVCTNLCKLPVVITDADDRLPNGGNLPQSYKFTCTDDWRDRGVPSCRGAFTPSTRPRRSRLVFFSILTTV